MDAVLQKSPGDADTMYVGQAPKPEIKGDEVLVEVHYTAINRADTLQRKGLYPPPAGASPIMGLECAGKVVAVGDDCKSGLVVGDSVMALLAGGGYAQFAAVQENCAMKIGSLSLETAGAIPETWLTAFQLLHLVGRVSADEYVLIHAGASGVGTAAIQLALQAGAKPIVTAGSAAKLKTCAELGAIAGFNYKEGPWADKVKAVTGGAGVNIVLDCVGASYVDQNVAVLAKDGRWVLFGLMGGRSVPEFSLGALLGKRIQLLATTLRTRSIEYKGKLVQRFAEVALEALQKGQMRPLIHKVYALNDIVAAHKAMEANENTGKIVIHVKK